MRVFKFKGAVDFAVKLAARLKSSRCTKFQAAQKAADYYRVNVNDVYAMMSKPVKGGSR